MKTFRFRKSVFSLFALSMGALWMARYNSGKMIISATNRFSRASARIVRPQRRSLFHSCLPGPLLVSASALPSVVSQLRSNRFGNSRFAYGAFYTLDSDSIVQSSRLDIHRYRGGTQYHPRQRRWHSSNRDDFSFEEEEEKDREINNAPSSLIRTQKRVTKVARQGAGAMFSFAGFVGSSFVSLATDHRSFEDRFLEPIRALRLYLKSTG